MSVLFSAALRHPPGFLAPGLFLILLGATSPGDPDALLTLTGGCRIVKVRNVIKLIEDDGWYPVAT